MPVSDSSQRGTPPTPGSNIPRPIGGAGSSWPSEPGRSTDEHVDTELQAPKIGDPSIWADIVTPPSQTAPEPSTREPEPSYVDYCPPGPLDPFLAPRGGRIPFMAIRRTRVARRIRGESEQEIGQLWGQVFFGVENLPPKTVIVTGARRGDGATHIATSLALVGATANRELRIALVDFNMRHPQIAELLGIRAEPGLTDVLDGRATFESTIQAAVLENGAELHVLTAGATAPQPLGLLKSRQTQRLIGRMAEIYDHVILDVSTANSFPDPQVLGALTDGAILVAKASDTPRETVAAAKRRLDVAGVRCLGVVLNQRTEPIPEFLYQKL